MLIWRVKAKDHVGLARELLQDIREVDRFELQQFDEDVERALVESMDNSADCYEVRTMREATLLAVFGLAKEALNDALGTPVWFIGVKAAQRYPREFLLHGREVCRIFLDRSGTSLCNFIWAGNTPALHFIKRLGGKLLEPIPLGNQGEMFYPFLLKEVK